MKKKHTKRIMATADKCVPIRKNINEVLYNEMAGLFDKFSKLADIKAFSYFVPNTGETVEVRPRALFKMAVDALHYRGGGYPGPSTLGHIESRLRYIGLVKYIFKKAKIESAFNKLLPDFGIVSIEINEEFFDAELGMSGVDSGSLRSILKAGDALQGDICNASNRIKRDAFESLGDEIIFHKTGNPEGVKKADFLKVVSIKSKKDVPEAKVKAASAVDDSILEKESFKRIIKKA